MSKPRHGSSPSSTWPSRFLYSFALVGLGYAAETGPLPARTGTGRTWRRSRAHGEAPDFCRFGDNRDEHPAVFGRVLKEVDRDPASPLPSIWATW